MPWLMVNGQVTSTGKQVDYGKTDAAIRPIALPDRAVALLRRRKVAQATNDLDEVYDAEAAKAATERLAPGSGADHGPGPAK